MTDNNTDGRTELESSLKEPFRQKSPDRVDPDMQTGLKTGKGYSQKRLDPAKQSSLSREPAGTPVQRSLSGEERHRNERRQRVIVPVTIGFVLGILMTVLIFRIIYPQIFYAPSSDTSSETNECIAASEEAGAEKQVISTETKADQGEGTPAEEESSKAREAATSDDSIKISDPTLKKAVQEALDIGNREITREEALMLTEFKYNGYTDPIKDITGLSAFENLTTLELRNNQFSSIEALSALANLTDLNLEDNQVSDISPLAGLTNLTHLNLEDNQVNDIGPLASLANLTHLDLDGNHVSDIKPLADLTKLTSLDLGWNGGVSDISPLAGLTNLTELYLYDNYVNDVSPLTGLTNLTDLELGGNGLSDISPLAGLTNLTYLGLDLNRVEDISALSGLTNLTKLVLSRNWISDINALSGLTKLTYLNLSGNAVMYTKEEIMEVFSGADNLTDIYY